MAPWLRRATDKEIGGVLADEKLTLEIETVDPRVPLARYESEGAAAPFAFGKWRSGLL
jgi:hypothetical protein